ncbi:regulator of G protein signaling domain-containing protein [Ilyonectria destructans]|nr:regulator of G protein signaling domain-containing protein [Ilyonectria destructans]
MSQIVVRLAEPAPSSPTMVANRINQSSSRLLKTTDDDRQLSRDLTDLFSTLIVSLLPLEARRVRFSKVENTFLAEDATHNLGNLKLLQSNTMPDPTDPSRTVVSTSTTIFSMSRTMACNQCQRFVDAHYIESADGKHEPDFRVKGVWKLTSKGITILNWFCAKNGIEHEQVQDLIGFISNPLIILERDTATDKLLLHQGTIEVIFRRLIGGGGRGMKAGANDYKSITGTERKVNGRTYDDTYSGQIIADWLLDHATTMDMREAVDVASLFVHYDIIQPIVHDQACMSQDPRYKLFQPTQHAVYTLSQHGQDLAENSSSGRCSSEGNSQHSKHSNSTDSNSQRLEKILADPTLRLLFRENLQETHCEENLAFYQEAEEFVRQCKAASSTQTLTDKASIEAAKELLAQSYIIFNTFLAPGSPRELNLNHQLRKTLADQMTSAQSRDSTIVDTLQEVTALFESARNSVFKLMASDSVPKFINSPKAEYQLAQAGVR